MKFRNRQDAGIMLAEKLYNLNINFEKALILALARGGVPVGFEVSGELGIKMELFVVRKIGAPQNKEYALGAISELNGQYLNLQEINRLGIKREIINEIISQEKKELVRRVKLYRGKRLNPKVFGTNTLLLVDDGIATGATIKAAISALNEFANNLVIASPVIGKQAYHELNEYPLVSEVVGIRIAQDLASVGNYYDDFSEVGDSQVIQAIAGSSPID